MYVVIWQTCRQTLVLADAKCCIRIPDCFRAIHMAVVLQNVKVLVTQFIGVLQISVKTFQVSIVCMQWVELEVCSLEAFLRC